jgi:nucleotide-binding universal stress UspA family protein
VILPFPRIGGRRPAVPPDPATLEIRRVLIASDGRPIPRPVIDYAAELAASGRSRKASVHVFSVARIYGTSLGMPMPGLMPTRQEWDAQRELVADAVRALKHRGLRSEGHVVATRNATKNILKTAEKHYCDVIVMAADPPRHGLLSDFMWSQEAHRVARRSPVPVYLVEIRQAKTA